MPITRDGCGRAVWDACYMSHSVHVHSVKRIRPNVQGCFVGLDFQVLGQWLVMYQSLLQ